MNVEYMFSFFEEQFGIIKGSSNSDSIDVENTYKKYCNESFASKNQTQKKNLASKIEAEIIYLEEKLNKQQISYKEIELKNFDKRKEKQIIEDSIIKIKKSIDMYQNQNETLKDKIQFTEIRKKIINITESLKKQSFIQNECNSKILTHEVNLKRIDEAQIKTSILSKFLKVLIIN